MTDISRENVSRSVLLGSETRLWWWTYERVRMMKVKMRKINGYTFLYFYYNYRLMYMDFQVNNLMRQITVEIVSIYFTLQVFSRLFHYNLNCHSTTTLSIKVSQISLILNIKEVTLVLLLKCTLYCLFRYSWRDCIQNLSNTRPFWRNGSSTS